jgi:hypothetical protein
MTKWIKNKILKISKKFNTIRDWRVSDHRSYSAAHRLKFLSEATKHMKILNNFNNDPDKDLFFAMSHGVHRGVLKKGKRDNREIFLNKLLKIFNKEIKFDLYGFSNRQPIWCDNFIDVISNSKMGLNLSRGEPLKYYSSDRIAQLFGNGL